MKILVVCQHYYPEPFRIPDICEELVRRGHEITVVTGVPNYPEGVVYKGYEKCSNSNENHNGVEIHRCFTIPRKTGFIHRFLNYYSFSFSSSRFVKRLDDDFDVVFVNQLSPVMMASAGILYAKKHSKPLVLYCLDLWPESLISGGIKRGSLIYRYYHRVSKNIYSKPDRLLITSNSFADYLEKEFTINKKKITYLPQYAEDLFEQVQDSKNDEIYRFVFAGNIGTAQSVITIVKAAQLLQDEPVQFHIVGSGIELNNLKKYVEDHKLSNVIFYGRRPLEEMPTFYSQADAMLLTLDSDPILSMTLPGKVQSYMEAGKPIIGAIDGESRRIIEEADCGFCGKATDEKELANNIRRFLECENKTVLADNAKKYYREHFSESIFMDRLIKALDFSEEEKL